MEIQLVLVRPAEPMNVGAVARAMKNCALERLTLVRPCTEDWVTARRVAVHAEDLLAAPRVVDSLSEAVADAVWVVGTTSRDIPGRKSLTPREVAAEAARMLASGPVGLVFGGEESGLSNEDLVRCHAVSRIPADSAQPSLNLAQAVLVYAYELYVTLHGPGHGLAPPLAADRELQQLERAMRELLEASGFADPDRPRHGVLDLIGTLRRAGLTPDEAQLWHAALRTALRAARK